MTRSESGWSDVCQGQRAAGDCEWAIESTLRELVTSISSATGEDFFRRMVRHLSDTLRVDYAFVGQNDDPEADSVATLAVHADGAPADNFEYELAGTPCEVVLGNGVCLHPRAVQEAFPEDALLREMGVESYAGTPLVDATGDTLGLIVVMSRTPLDRPDLALSLLQVFGWRAGTELVRMRTADALQRGRQTQRALLEAIPDLILRVGKDGIFRDFKLPGTTFPTIVPPDRMIGRHIRDVLPPPAAEDCEVRLGRALGTGETQVYEFQLPVGESTRRFEARIVSRDEDEALAIVRDVSQRAEQEEQILYQQKLESLGVLAGGIAHDFNNLLMGILGYAGLALGKIPAGAPARKNIESIRSTADRAAALTNQMLAYSGEGPFIVETCNLSELIDESLPLIKVSTTGQTEIEYRLAADLPPVSCDVNQIRQVVVNLVTNAVEALGPGGFVTIATGASEATAEELSHNALREELAPGRFVFLDVTDTGSGMSAETSSKIFDPFFSTKFIGRGLGLAAVQGIVRAHRGGILLDTTPGRGTRFRILLPAPVTAETAGAEAPDPALAGV